MKKLICFILFFTSTAFAADKTAYVNTDCTFSGTGASASCAVSGGAAGAWKTCALMITGETLLNANLTTLGGNLIVNFSGATADAQCIPDGFTGMDSTHLLRFIGNRTTVTAWDATKYHISCSTNGSGCLEPRDPYIELFNMQIETTGSGSGDYRGLNSGSGTLYIKAANNIFRDVNCNTGGGGSCNPVSWRPNVANTVNIFYNNIGIGGTTSGNAVFSVFGSLANNGEITVLYNNSAYGGKYGFETHGGGSSDAEYIKNNVSNGAFTAAYNLDASAGFATNSKLTNVSNDTSSPNAALQNKTCTFVSTTGGSEDLALQAGDTNCKNAGTDLTTDASSQQNVTTDIATTARPQGSAFDVGAFELVGSSTPTFSVFQAIGAL